MPVWLTVAATSLYVAALFAIAWRRDRRGVSAVGPDAVAQGSGVGHPAVYALGIAVYCTSWTYFGAVGTAVANGWDYLPIYLGPAIVFLAMPGTLRRIADIAQRENITSLSDFISARYGKSRSLAALVTMAAVVGSLPYIALQLKSVGSSFEALTGGLERATVPAATPAIGTVLLTAAVLAAFAILFGARHAEANRRNPGLMQVLAVEAVIKLAALMIVCLLSVRVWLEAPDPVAVATVFRPSGINERFITVTLLAMAAILCLPRQFHVAIVERRSDRDLSVARWLFPLYLLITSAVMIPIALAGLTALPAGAAPDLFVIHLPLAEGSPLLALFVFLGGLSAASGMVIVSMIALSTMVTNDLIVPLVMRSGRLASLSGDGGDRLVVIRRLVVGALMALAFGYHQVSGGGAALAQIGLLSFGAAIQFAPLLIAGIYWKGGRRQGAIAGLIAGMTVWLYTLALPGLFGIEAMQAAVPGWADPYGLFGLTFRDSLTHGTLLSLGANIGLFVLVSLLSRERLRDRIQAAAFVSDGPERLSPISEHEVIDTGVTPDGLKALAARFLTADAVEHAFERFGAETGVTVAGNGPASWQLVQRTEHLLASALGASSARVVMSSAVGGGDVGLGDVLTILDHKTQAKRFERHMLQSMLESIPQGISVVDHEQKLVAWNSAYVTLFGFPPQLIHVGQPIRRLIEHNLSTGWLQGEPEEVIRRRIEHMRVGRRHEYERVSQHGVWLRITGQPMPGGGYVTVFADITQDKEREQALIEANEMLEVRVRERTSDLEDMAAALESARLDAEAANASKTRFLAAASHDLLQPLNAARLFLGSIETEDSEAGERTADLVAKTERAILSSDDLLRGLLDITRLDQREAVAKPRELPLGPVLEDLADEAAPMAAKAGLRQRLAPTSLWVNADPDFLQSILRNFLSNARRYTREGGVLIGARRRGTQVRIEVWDSGPGMPEDKLALIFDEFQRFEERDNMGVRGAGLGLSIARRLATLMDADIGVRSVPGRGSVFHVTVPAAAPTRSRAMRPAREAVAAEKPLDGVSVLCIDDEASILEGMEALLRRWGCRALTAVDWEEAMARFEAEPVDAVIADLQLKEDQDGLDLIAELRRRSPGFLPAALLTARTGPHVDYRCARMCVDLLRKPADPEAIRQFLVGMALPQGRGRAAGRTA